MHMHLWLSFVFPTWLYSIVTFVSIYRLYSAQHIFYLHSFMWLFIPCGSFTNTRIEFVISLEWISIIFMENRLHLCNMVCSSSFSNNYKTSHAVKLENNSNCKDVINKKHWACFALKKKTTVTDWSVYIVQSIRTFDDKNHENYYTGKCFCVMT